MFYKVTLQKVINVPPRDLGRTLHRRLLVYLRQAVEGKPLPSPDMVSTVADFKNTSKSSAVVIAVLDILHAEALQVLKLHRGEVIDVLVDNVGQEGWWGSVYGIGKVFVSQSQMSSDPAQMDWIYESDGDGGFWVSSDGMRSVKVNEIVRIRVVAETPQSRGAMAVGTMIGPCLGPL